jgi:hypothetical protein
MSATPRFRTAARELPREFTLTKNERRTRLD